MIEPVDWSNNTTLEEDLQRWKNEPDRVIPENMMVLPREFFAFDPNFEWPSWWLENDKHPHYTTNEDLRTMYKAVMIGVLRVYAKIQKEKKETEKNRLRKLLTIDFGEAATIEKSGGGWTILADETDPEKIKKGLDNIRKELLIKGDLTLEFSQ